jgi:hypothetical protein
LKNLIGFLLPLSGLPLTLTLLLKCWAARFQITCLSWSPLALVCPKPSYFILRIIGWTSQTSCQLYSYTGTLPPFLPMQRKPLMPNLDK